MPLAGLRLAFLTYVLEHRPVVSAPGQHRHRLQPCQAASNGLSNGSAKVPKTKVPVVVLPGFLMGKDNYVKMASTLEALGHPTSIADIRALQWLPTLQGADFSWYLERAQAAIHAASEGSASKVAIVGHSAGGWLARLLMGEAPYMGRCWDLRQHISSLVTLGSPHLSVEAYPFGRTMERRSGEPQHLPSDVRGSSLRFVNHFYTTAQAIQGVKIKCVAGTGIKGSSGLLLVRHAQRLEAVAANRSLASIDTPEAAVPWQAAAAVLEQTAAATGQKALAVSSIDQWLAGGSYAANCLDAAVEGDGVCPTRCALLPGAHAMLLRGVWHTAAHKPWYGSPEVVEAWEPLLE